MATISKEYTFESAHTLPLHNGKCANRHGHSYRVIIRFTDGIQLGSSPGLSASSTGMVRDYGWIDERMKYIVGRLDHHDLNELMTTPTAEVIALWILIRLADNPVDARWEVTVCETAKTTATVSSEDYQAYQRWYRTSRLKPEWEYGDDGLVNYGVGDLFP